MKMYYIYNLQSTIDTSRYYIGFSESLTKRFKSHNLGQSVHTSKYKPWKLINYFAFTDKRKAIKFEKYLKSGSGRAFSKKHF